MLLRHYEIPDGRSSGQPEVLVADTVVSKLGMPSVNYDGLHEYLTDDLGIPYDSPTRIKLYGKHNNSETRGYRVPYTDTFHVDAVTAEAQFPRTGGVMRVIAYEGRRRADSETHRLLSTSSAAGGVLAYTVPFGLVNELTTLPKFFVVGVATSSALGLRSRFERHISPVGRRALRQQEDPSTLAHEGDIIFPKSLRTIIFMSRKLGNVHEPAVNEKYHKKR